MDIHHEEAVATWLVADGRTLIAPQYPVRIGEPDMKDPVLWPDILAVRPKERRIFLCEVTWSRDWSKYRKKVADYRNHLDSIRTNLDHWHGIGAENKEWRISIWYFVPETPHVEKVKSMEPDDGPDVLVTPLECIRPWNYTWGFRPSRPKIGGNHG